MEERKTYETDPGGLIARSKELQKEHKQMLLEEGYIVDGIIPQGDNL